MGSDIGVFVVSWVEFRSVLVLTGRCLPFSGENLPDDKLIRDNAKGVWLPVVPPWPETGFTQALISDGVLGCWGLGGVTFLLLSVHLLR